MRALIVIFLLVACGSATPQNILLFILDDIGTSASVPYGCDESHMPNIDRLATSGMTFGNFYAHRACAVSRGSLYTGRDAYRLGIANPSSAELPADEYCFVRAFRDAGYHTWLSGKYNMAKRIFSEFDDQDASMYYHGFNTNLSFRGPTITYLVDDEQPCTSENFWPYLYQNFTLDQLEEVGTDPFFGIHSFGLAHSPWDVGSPDNPGATNSTTESFWAKVDYMDKVYSNTVAKLNELGLLEDTLIIVVGDNGTDASVTVQYQGQSIAGGKFGDGIGQHVPCFFSCPGYIDAGSTYSGITSFHDLGLTLIDMVGLSMPTDRVYDGRSFAQGLTGQISSHKRTAVFGSSGGIRSALNIDYVYESDGTLSSLANKPYSQPEITEKTGVEILQTIELSTALIATRDKQFGDNPWGGHVDETILLTDSTNYIPIEVISLAVSGASTVAHETTNQYEAVATYTDLALSNVTASAVWTKDNTNTTINAGELIVGTMTGTQTVTIAASFGGIANALAVELQGVIPPPAPPTAGLVQWLTAIESDGMTVQDDVDPLIVDPEPTLIGANCLAGPGTITSAAFETGQTITRNGTATPTVGSGTCSFGAGSISLISINGVPTFNCGEGSGLPLDSSGNGNHATACTATWTNDMTGAIVSANHVDGNTPSVVSFADEAYIDLGFVANENTKTEWVGSFSDVTINQQMGSITPTIVFGTSSSGYFFSNFGNAFTSSSVPATQDQVYTLTQSKDGFFADDVLAGDYSAGDWSFSGSETYYILGRNHSTELTYDGVTYSFKAWEDGELIRDMVPINDGQFLDLVEMKVYSIGAAGTLVTRHIPALNDGSGFDALNGEALANAGGFVHNGSEMLIPSYSGTNSYADLLTYTNDTDSIRVKLDENNMIEEILEYSTAPTGDDLDELNAYLEL